MTSHMPSRFVVVGAGGFLGSNLVRFLMDHTLFKVVAVSSQESAKVTQKVARVEDREINFGDRLQVVGNEELLESAFLSSGDAVVNCAFPWNRGGFALAEGLDFSGSLFRAASDADVKIFINISSQSVYCGQRVEPASEADKLDLDSPYATGKYAMELLAAALLSSVPVVNVRMASLIGRGYDVRILNRFIRQALEGRPLVVEHGEQLFSYLDVRDACRGIVAVATTAASSSSAITVNIGTSRQTSLRQIAVAASAAADSVTGRNAPVLVHDDGKTDSPSPRSALDCGLAKELYGFEAELTIEQTAQWIAEEITSKYQNDRA